MPALLRKPGALCLALMLALPAAGMPFMTPPPSLGLERVDSGPWRSYLAASSARRAADQEALARERAGLAVVPPALRAGGPRDGGMPLERAPAWYGSPAALQVADQIVSFQTPSGGWGKNTDRTGPPRQRGQHYVAIDTPGESWNFVGTIDNSATTTELRFLALVQAQAAPELALRYRAAFDRGIAYLLASQYPNGGLPQVYPLQGGYHDAITLNDHALAEVLELFQRVAERRAAYAFVPAAQAAQAGRAADNIISMLLAAQIEVNGVKTGWCQQHDAVTLAPVGARNFEPAALASMETARILSVLMQLPAPSDQVAAAVHAGAAWLQRTALRDVEFSAPDAASGRMLLARPGAGPLWSRYYDIATMKPIFGERDRSIHDNVNALSKERRNGYAWYGDGPAHTLARYARWAGQSR